MSNRKAQPRLSFLITYHSLLITTFYFIAPNIGEWRVSRTLPSPRYMWTPQGRHGSKLRTARMMSMPLKFSGPFSSKMGVFCTASSYGPGVPYMSRGLAFHGVGGYG